MTAPPKPKRPQDYRSEWAAKSLLHTQLLGRKPGHWVLKENGRVVDKWRESDRPGLSEFLVRKLAGHHGAWHVARGAALSQAAIERSQHAGVKGAEERWGPQKRGGVNKPWGDKPRRKELEAQIAGALARGEDPYDHVADWVRTYHYCKRQVRRIIGGK